MIIVKEYFFGYSSVVTTICFILGVVICYLIIRLNSAQTKIIELEQKCGIDPLTGVMNRREFISNLNSINNRLSIELDKRRSEEKSSLNMFFIDIDHFKKINDTYGHQYGDQILGDVANRIKQTIRKSDLLCRWGGEEFLVATQNMLPTEVSILAEKLRMSVNQIKFLDSKITVSISIGVKSTNKRVEIDSFIAEADAAMYQAKKNGRNQVVVSQF